MTKKINIGDVVAFNTLKDAVWFDVVDIKGFALIVREAGTANATQVIDRSYVKQSRRNMIKKVR